MLNSPVRYYNGQVNCKHLLCRSSILIHASQHNKYTNDNNQNHKITKTTITKIIQAKENPYYCDQNDLLNKKYDSQNEKKIK